MISIYELAGKCPPALAPSPPCHLLFIFGIRPHRFACITYVPVIQSESLAHATTGLAT